jgi:ADP-ribose pyrophosphatase YjhB (NUDIX family)
MTTRTEAAALFAPTLAAHTPFADREIEWPQIRLRLRGYAVGLDVPDIMISSVRAVVFRGSRVVVVHDPNGIHITPGGRREPGETVEETCRRELLEECGWRVGELRPLAIWHFQHLNDEPPPDFPFEWCDFANLIYLAEGVAYDRRALDRSQGELGSRLMSPASVRSMLPPEQPALLDLALAARREGRLGR